MLDQVIQTHKNTIYTPEELQSIINEILETQQMNLLINPSITVTDQKMFKITAWISIDEKKAPVLVYFLFQKDGIKSFLTKPSNQWKFIPKYDNQFEPDLSAQYAKNSQLNDVVIKLRTEFKQCYPYSQNSVVIQKDPVKIELEKNIIKYTDKMEKDYKDVKELGDQLFQEYQQVQEQRAKLKQLKVYIKGLNEKLKDEIKCMEQFTADYSQQEVNEDNILQILSLNQVDDQICNLQANIYGIRDTYKYIQNRMKTSSNVTLEWVCSIVKQLAEQEFNDIQLLKKCNRQF